MDIISGNVTTTQEISGEVSPIKSVFGEATLLQATWTSISGKPFDSLDESDFEVVDGVLKVIGGGGGGGTSTLCWLPSVSNDGVISFRQSTSITPPTAVNIKGPKGDTGSQGIQGLQGLKGDKGDTGEKGTDGINGTNGADGQDGFSPTITVYENTDTSYKLSVTDVNGSFQTPNLKGSSGGGTGGTTDYTALSNKPTINTVELIGNKTSADLGIASAEHSHTVSNISDFPTSLPASDVSEWAKSPTKPTYTVSEVGALPDTTVIPTKTSQLTNDSNFATDSDLSNKVDKVTGKSLMSDTEIERLASIVNYNDTSVQAHMSNTDIHVTIANKTNWDSKANGTHTHVKTDITDFPIIPTVTNDLTNGLKSNYDTAYNHSLSAHAPTNAEANVQSDWLQTDTAADDYIKNKPTIPEAYTLPTASTTVKGGIKVDGTSITVDENGVASAIESGGGLTEADVFAICEAGVTTLGDQITTISWYMSRAYIPSSVISMGGNWFRAAIATYKINGGEHLTTVGTYFAQSCTALTTISLPALTTVGDYFATVCTALTTISLPVLTTVGAFFAQGCTALKTISLPTLTTVNTFFASSCTALTTISLPTLTTVGYSFAGNCTALKTISLPALTTVSYSFAGNCTALTTISLPALTTVGDCFAYNCPLTHLVVGGANTLTLTSTSSNTYTAWKLPVDDMVAFGTALKTAKTATALTFGTTYWNALSAAQKAIFTNKNYTVTTA